ncbi:hypothetical protein ACWEFD_33645 [Streptomyces ardesiacus]
MHDSDTAISTTTQPTVGHYHFRHSEQAVLDGKPVLQEIFDWDDSADVLAVLDQDNDVPRFEAVAMG